MRVTGRISLAPTPSDVSRFNAWFDQRCAESRIERGLAYDLKLCINEVLANQISYGFRNTSNAWVVVKIRLKPGRGSATIIDNGTYFDVRRWEPPKNRDLRTAEPGGFGVALIKERASKIRYARLCRLNRLKIVCNA